MKLNEFNIKIQYKLNEIRDREQQTIKTMARGAGVVFVGMIAARVLGYILRVLLKRHLGLDDFGLVSTGVVIMEIATMLSVMGLPQAIARFIAFHLSRKEYSKVAGTLKASFIIGLPCILLTSGLVYLFASVLANHVFQKPGLLYVIHRFWLLIPLLGITMLSSSVLRGLKQMFAMIFSQQIARNLFVLFCFVLLALAGFKLDSAIYGYIYGFIIMAALSLLLVARAVPYKELFARKPAKMASILVTYSWPLVFSTILWFLIGRVDTLFLASFMTIDQAGIYNAVLPLAQFVTVTPQSFAMISMPLISGVFARGDESSLEPIYLTTSKWLLMFTLPVYLPIVIYAEPLLVKFFGSDCASGAVALRILSTGFFVNAVVGPATMTLSADARTRLILLNTLVSLLINVVCNITLIPLWGISGSATASALAVAGTHIIAAVQAYHLYGVVPFKKVFLRIIAVAATAVALVGVADVIFGFEENLLNLTALSFVLIGLYLAGLLVTRCFDSTDIIILESLEAKFNVHAEFLKRFMRD